MDVLWEYKTRGILTKTILAIVAMDDGLALLLYGFAGSLATVLVSGGHGSWVVNLLMPFWEIFGAVAIGLVDNNGFCHSHFPDWPVYVERHSCTIDSTSAVRPYRQFLHPPTAGCTRAAQTSACADLNLI